MIPLPVRASEVLDVSEAEWQALDEAGMITHDLTPEEVGQALVVKGRHPGLSANDCFCRVTAQVYLGILLTGDGSAAQGCGAKRTAGTRRALDGR